MNYKEIAQKELIRTYKERVGDVISIYGNSREAFAKILSTLHNRELLLYISYVLITSDFEMADSLVSLGYVYQLMSVAESFGKSSAQYLFLKNTSANEYLTQVKKITGELKMLENRTKRLHDLQSE